MSLPTGEALVPAEGFSVIGTSNSPPEDLDPALRSRFEVEIHLPEPAPAIVARMNQSAVGLGEALADSYRDPQHSLDPRKLLSFVSLRKAGVPSRQAALMVFGQRAPDVMAALSARGVKIR